MLAYTRANNLTQLQEYLQDNNYCKAELAMLRKPAISGQPRNRRKISEGTIKDLIAPEPISRFENFKYKLYRKKHSKDAMLAQVRDSKTKPANINNDNTTFGMTYEKQEKLYDLVFPHQNNADLKRDFKCSQEKKWKTPKTLNGNYSAAAKFSIDKVGPAMTDCAPKSFINKPHKLFLDRTGQFLGVKNRKYDFDLPKLETYGISTSDKDACSMKCVMGATSIKTGHEEEDTALTYIHNIRRAIHNHRNFNIYDLFITMKRRDVDKSGHLKLTDIFRICKNHFLRLDQQKVITALACFKLIQRPINPDSSCDYASFCNLLDKYEALPALEKRSRTTDDQIKLSTYRSMCNDVDKFEYKQPVKIGQKPAADCIAKNIPTNCYLNVEDFQQPRSKEQLRRIFHSVLSDEESFENAWQDVKSKVEPLNDLISVNDLYTAIKAEMLKKLE